MRAIIKELSYEGNPISCEHRVFTSIAAMEHSDSLGIPVFHEPMVTIDLHLISFTVVVSLILDSGVVGILGLLIPYIFHVNNRRVR